MKIRLLMGMGMLALLLGSAHALPEPARNMVPEMDYTGPDTFEAHGGMTIESVDLDQQVLTLRYYTNPIEGEYKLISCLVDNQARIEKDGQQIQLADLHDGDCVIAESLIYDSNARSCGTVQFAQCDKKKAE